MGWHRNHAISHSPNQIFFRTPSFPIQGVPMNNLAPMKNCPGGGVQGNLNWMPGYGGWGQKLKIHFFRTNGHVAYQIKGNGG